ncbi:MULTISPECIES: hypothetical protein [unclassified Rubrivivax]|uniref:hypothetical protein n=1 Tax=unclassified Rubrivivax TaxID=2649762 RepID=UPI001E524100|nr:MULTISPECIES: hypothetical protein [unclassified Rubrivivax]MCC9598837.1 hypothetical protein [Rubrivivax sp. JA1055]MCC9648537.1 hypothetical protein [Rubrivivax sp. JA1029]
MPGLGETDDLVAAGVELGQAQRGFVRFGAGGQQQRTFQPGRRDAGELGRQFDDRAAQHAAEQVVQALRVLGDDLGDLRVAVA